MSMVDVLDAAILAFVAGILATAVEAGRRRDVAAAVNALVALAATLLPTAVAVLHPVWRGWTVPSGPELTLWLAVAGFLHSLGMLGLYESVWWWDHLTHVVSAALVAALVYAGFVVVGRTPGGFQASVPVVAVLTVAFTFLAGVFWEAIELLAREVGDRLDVEPVLVHYGWRDTGFDLLFDLVGATLVVVFDLRTFVSLADVSVGATRAALVASGGLFLLGTVAMAGVVRVDVG